MIGKEIYAFYCAQKLDEKWKTLDDLIDEHLQSAILAEREACAKAMDQQMDIARNEALKAKEKSDEYTVKYYQGCYEGSRRAQLIIRARSNAPESPNKPQVGFFGLDLSSRKAKEENVAPDPVSA